MMTHDAIWVEAPHDDESEVRHLMRRMMTTAGKLDVPLEVETAVEYSGGWRLKSPAPISLPDPPQRASQDLDEKETRTAPNQNTSPFNSPDIPPILESRSRL